MPHLGAAVALLGLIPLLGATGCDVMAGPDCTEASCSDRVELTLSDNGGLPAGHFDLVVAIDGETHACSVTVNGRDDLRGTCSAFFRDTSVGDRTVRDLVVAVPLGRGVGVSEVAVRVEGGGEVRADGPVALTVAEDFPNGMDCPPVCRVFAARVALG